MDRRRSRAFFQPLFLVTVVACFCCLSAWALPQPQDLASLASMEQSLYSVRYDKDPVEQRLSRLEATILGDAQPSQSIDDRLLTLKRVFSTTQPAPLSSKAQTAMSQPPQTGNLYPPTSGDEPSSPYSPSPATAGTPSSESDYPTVTAMENKVLGRAYGKDDINQRLQRLEKQVFGGAHPGALVDRVDALRLAVLGDTGAGQPPAVAAPPSQDSGWGAPPDPTASYSPSANYSPWYPATPPTQPAMAYSPYTPQPPTSYPGNEYTVPPPMMGTAPSSDIVAAIGQVEQQVLHKTYPADPVDSRLSRLEAKIFHVSAPPTLSEQDRLQRIIAVASAGGSNGPSSTAAMTMRGVLPMLLMLLPLLL